MKHNRLYLIILSGAAIAMLSGCSTSNQRITATPSPYTVKLDRQNSAKLDMTLHVPQNYFSSRSRLVIVPQLMAGDETIQELEPMVLDAPIYTKKKMRRVVLESYVDPYSGKSIAVNSVHKAYELPYNAEVRLPKGVGNARVVGIVTTDGCGKCTGMDTIELVTLAKHELPDLRGKLQASMIERQFVLRPKVMESKGEARMQFAVSKYDIRPSLGNNREELDRMVNALAPILRDSLATLTSLSITGTASAEGSIPFNTKLAKNRAEAARLWLISQLNIKPAVSRLITTDTRAEGWQPVLDAMKADGNPSAEAVEKILTKYADSDDDVQEYYIRRLPGWKADFEKYLRKDRLVEYKYTYRLKSFTTDAEMLEMYGKRKDAFNEEELLRVAQLVKGTDAQEKVYKEILQRFPNSQTAANNLAVLYINDGRLTEARRILSEQKQLSPEIVNTLAVCYAYEGNLEEAARILQDVDLPQARCNLETINNALEH